MPGSPRVSLYGFDSGTLGLGGIEVPVPFLLDPPPAGRRSRRRGQSAGARPRPARALGELANVFEVHMTEEQHCVPQLGPLGVEPHSVGHVVQTHLHIDHTGTLGHFPDATVVVHSRELQAARAAEDPLATGYVRADYERPELRWQLVDGELDLFGDGTIRLLETPGDSAGHMSLLLDLEETGPVLITADAADNRAQWEGREHPRALFSREDASRSLQRLRELAQQADALVVFGHDPRNWSELRRVRPAGPVAPLGGLPCDRSPGTSTDTRHWAGLMSSTVRPREQRRR
jgi:N-acyl homoserine lactone hydrolase